MAGQIVGYRRVSSADQNLARQELGDDVEKVFEDKLSGATTDRPGLAEMRRYVREGDTVRVWSMDRLGRSLIDLVQLIQEFTDGGVTVEFMSEGLTFKPGGTDPFAELQLHLIAAVAQFQRSMIKRAQAEGIAKAKARGVYRGSAPKLSVDQVNGARERIAAGVPKSKVARDLGVARQTLYTALAANPS